MVSILLTFLMIWLMIGFIKFAWSATWGIFKLAGIILSVIAFPIVLIGSLVIGIGTYLILPVILIGLAFGLISRAS